MSQSIIPKRAVWTLGFLLLMDCAPQAERVAAAGSGKKRGLLDQFESEGTRVVFKTNVADAKLFSALSSRVGVQIPSQVVQLVLKGLNVKGGQTGAAICYDKKFRVKRGGRVLNPGYLVIMRRGRIEAADPSFDDVLSVGVAVSDRGELKVAQARSGGHVERMWGDLKGKPIAFVIVTLVR